MVRHFSDPTPSERKAVSPEEFVAQIGEYADDPLSYVLFNWPWDDESGPLMGRTLREWQRDFFIEWGQEIRARGYDGITAVDPILFSTVSGHGVGKSATNAMALKFVHDTRPMSRGTVTANTATQLVTRTWAEVGKWHRLSSTRPWSSFYANRGNMALVNRQYPHEWRIDAFTARKENAEAFQGQHAEGSSSFYAVDEASGVPQEIFDPMQGGILRGESMIFLWGNGTRNSGFFYQTHKGSIRDRWIRRQVDSRDVEGSEDNRLIQMWIEDYGIDSDFVRVRVRGEFPKSSALQFISLETVDYCVSLDLGFGLTDPLIFGVDVARFGDDSSVIYKRRGRDARTLGYKKWGKLDTVTFATIIAKEADQDGPDAIFVDGSGVGGPVVDMLRSMNVPNVYEINGANKATGRECANMRAQCWWNMREAMEVGIALPDDPDLRDDLIGLEYGYRISDNKILLERKEIAKLRGVASPDIADALSLTYALPIAPRKSSEGSLNGGTRGARRPSNLITDH